MSTILELDLGTATGWAMRTVDVGHQHLSTTYPMTTTNFDTWRRTGPLTTRERIALAALLADHPRPLWSPRALKPTAAGPADDLAFGTIDLQQRGWVRVRGLAWELTARCARELPTVAGPDAWNALPALVRAEAAAALAAVAELASPADEQRARMPAVLAWAGWAWMHDPSPAVKAYHAALFASLMRVVADSGVSTEERAGLLAELKLAAGEVSVDVMRQARAICADLDLDAFRSAMGSAAWMLTRRADITVH